MIEKTARELAGTPCLELDEPDPPKQEICCSRMFGTRLTELAPIKEAVATYMMRASEKLRAQNSLCKKVRVSIRTGMFNPEEAKYANGVVIDMPYPTDDVRLLTKAAVAAVDRVYRPGFKYSKAEVLLMSLCQPGEYTDDLFAASQPTESTKVMAVLDQINERWGRGTLRAASVPSSPVWAMRREMMSQSYTTRLDQHALSKQHGEDTQRYSEYAAESIIVNAVTSMEAWEANAAALTETMLRLLRS